MSPKRGIRKICRYLIYSVFFFPQVDLSEKALIFMDQEKSILNRKIPDFLGGGEAVKLMHF